MHGVIVFLLTTVNVVSAIMLLGVILIQKSKSQGAGLAFGGTMGESMFGAQMGNVLTKTTVILAIVFLLNTTLLALIGGRMIREALSDEEKPDDRDPTRGLSLVMLSIATSIDALAVGFSLSVIGISIWFPAFVIGLVAGALTVVGMLVGHRIGDRWGPRVEILGGIVLITIGVRILCEHLLA